MAAPAPTGNSTLTFAELSELDSKTRDRAMAMLAEHKDFGALVQALRDKRAEEQKRREELGRIEEQRQKLAAEREAQWRAESEAARIAKEIKDAAESKRVSTLTLEQKKAERYAIEKRRYSGWTLMGGGLDANEDWDNEHERLNNLYGDDTYIPKKPHPYYTSSSNHPTRSNGDSDAESDAEPDPATTANSDADSDTAAVCAVESDPDSDSATAESSKATLAENDTVAAAASAPIAIPASLSPAHKNTNK